MSRTIVQHLWLLPVLLLLACPVRNDDDHDPFCGDGRVDLGEICDPGIEGGAGACPEACDDGRVCTTDVLTGSPDACNAECFYRPTVTCQDGDGCCPGGCSPDRDADCAPGCGNGALDPGERCDGDCPTTCDDSIACTLDVMIGAPSTCDAACTYDPVGVCQDGDGCCPAGCDAEVDGDCSTTCGNGQVEAGEVCDGDCPEDCDDSVACTTDVLTGSASTCSAACSHQPVRSCAHGDGCCPAGCTFGTDDDCACTKATCQDLGLSCGAAPDGCGGTLTCPTCADGAVCSGGTCVASARKIGDVCAGDGDCDTGGCVTQTEDGWPGGYCSRTCLGNAVCGAGSHCGFRNAQGEGICVKDCGGIGECRSGYECWDMDTDGSAECAPVGTGAGPVGAACTSTLDCAGGRGVLCATQAQQFKGGYCTLAPCSAGSCPGDAHCAFIDPATGRGSCVAGCAGDAGCRSDGYRCFDADRAGGNECWPAATGNGAVGAACAQQWDCAGNRYGFCAQAPAWPQGYCMVECTSGSGTSCPTGSTCVPFPVTTPVESYCLDSCAGAQECRAGYQCTNEGGTSTLECNPI